MEKQFVPNMQGTESDFYDSQIAERRERMNRRFFLIGLGVAAVLAGYGIVNDNIGEKRTLRSYTGTKEKIISKGDTYWNYAVQARREYPQLREFNINDIIYEIKKVNDDEPLIAGRKVKIPVWPRSSGNSNLEASVEN